jgi:hypothetical protein
MENDVNLELNDMPTDKALLGAYLGKSEKLDYYLAAYQKMNQSGVFGFKWYWSWWAFFGVWAFMLYRKAYIPALVTFVVSMIIGMIPLGFLFMMVATGGVVTFYSFIILGFVGMLMSGGMHH